MGSPRFIPRSKGLTRNIPRDALPISAMSRDHPMTAMGRGYPCPPVSPNFTQCHPRSPNPGSPAKAGFGLLGWKVTQPGVPGKGRFWLARVEAARPALPKYQVLMTKYRSYVKELFTSRH